MCTVKPCDWQWLLYSVYITRHCPQRPLRPTLKSPKPEVESCPTLQIRSHAGSNKTYLVFFLLIHLASCPSHIHVINVHHMLMLQMVTELQDEHLRIDADRKTGCSWLEGAFKDHLIQPSCHKQGQLPLDQVT